MLSRLKEFSKKQIIALIVLAAADVFVIAIPYYLKNIIPNFNLYLGIREDQVAILIAIIGIVTLVTQLPGGFLANKFSSRWLLFGAIVSTAMIAIWFGILVLNQRSYQTTEAQKQVLFAQYAIIWGLWGVTSTLIFWTPLWKLVSQQAKKENQGFAYGLESSFNGIIGFVLIWALGFLIVTFWIGKLKKNEIPSSGVPFAVYVFIVAAFLLVVSVLVFTLVPERPLEKAIEDETTEVTPKEKSLWSWDKFKLAFKEGFKQVKSWKLWALALFLMGMYTFQTAFPFYVLQTLVNEYKAPTWISFILTGILSYGFRIFISWVIGGWADKTRSYILFLVTSTGLAIVSIIAILLIGFINNPIVVIVTSIVLFMFIGSLSWAMATLRYTQLNEIHIEKNSYASSVGVMSFIGFSLDAWFYPMSSAIGKAYTPKFEQHTSLEGYRIIIIIALVIAFLGLLAGIAVFVANTRELKRLGKTTYRWRELVN
ncbi:Na+/melibiose symporter-like transporter [Mycoplasmopsis mustelae]|uniref:Na+/melibiose symporter-like transporter n=1 Tax=Mycoplasmopsis mustelae TaxID=171289 RepID=A0A4R7UFG5_9BACT|nr:MFS transporter [Mycoplasmopsis mustelae]TDV24434.1 Na+/melibiose symporter-like transporter [Mycoplasmopsis mustelae]